MNKNTYDSFVILPWKTVIVTVVLLMERCDVLQSDCVWKPSFLRGGHVTAGGQLHKSNRRLKEMDFEVVMVMRALWTKHSGLLPQPTLLPVSWPPSTSLHTRRGVGACIEVNWTRSFLNFCHRTHPPCLLVCPFFLSSHTHADTHRQWSKGTLPDTGQEISVYVDEAPLPVRSRRAATPLIQAQCALLDFTFPQKHYLWI